MGRVLGRASVRGATLKQTSPAPERRGEIRCQISGRSRVRRRGTCASRGRSGSRTDDGGTVVRHDAHFETLSNSSAAPPARAASTAHGAPRDTAKVQSESIELVSSSSAFFPKARRLVIATARFRQRARAGESSAALARASSASHPSPGIDTIDHGPLRPHGHRQVGDAEGAARRHPAAGGHPRARRGRRHHRRHLLRHAGARLRVQVPGRETLRRACPASIHHPRPALTALAAASRARFRRQPSAGRHFFVR